MSENDKSFTGSIPDTYDEFLVPLIFESYARDLAARVTSTPVKDVLETAAGSGVVTRALAKVLAPDARYHVTDLNPPMLARARSRQTPDDRITWQATDALDLPYPDDSFDAVCCQFGVMFFPDRVKGYGEARRVLRPDGRFHFNVWDTIGANAFADVVTQVAGTLLPPGSVNFLARTPHGHGNPDRIRADLEAAGYTDIVIDQVTEISTAPHPSHPAVAYVRGTPLFGEIAPHGDAMVDRVIHAATEEIAARYGAEDGSVSAQIQGYVISAG
ncbi:methyltransferase domain-containing protein [Aliisedimentitalea scapharcae]|uniref:Methyltransferase domain-containing protein n=1 Tax=Aliisedimentitalea scapharcae TaxID=1524259 RepID=A0ABZ2XQL1_9RHOB